LERVGFDDGSLDGRRRSAIIGHPFDRRSLTFTVARKRPSHTSQDAEAGAPRAKPRGDAPTPAEDIATHTGDPNFM